MTRVDRTFDGGTLGATPGAPDIVAYSGTGTWTYDNTHTAPATSTMAVKQVPTASSASFGRLITGLAATQLAVTVKLWTGTTGSAQDEELFRVANSGTTKILAFTRNTSGRISVTDVNGTSPRLYVNTTATHPINQWITIKLWMQVGTANNNSTVKYAMYDESGVLIPNASGGVDANTGGTSQGFISTAANLWPGGVAGVIDRIELGRTGTATNADARWYDTISWDTAATDLLPDFVTSAQFESVDAEALIQSPPDATAESVDAEALVTAPSGLQAETVWAEVLFPIPPVAMVTETVWAEVLFLSPPTGSNVFTSDGVEHQAYRWDGSQTVFVIFGT